MLIDETKKLHGQNIRRFCWFLASQNRDLKLDPEDIEQETWLRVHARTPSLPDTDSIVRFFYVVARRYVYKSAARLRTQTSILDWISTTSTFTSTPTIAERLDTAEEANITVSYLVEFLHSRNYFCATCFVLRSLFEMTYDKIASVIDQAVKTHLQDSEDVDKTICTIVREEFNSSYDLAHAVLTSLHAKEHETRALLRDLLRRDSDYWHIGEKRQYDRLRAWTHRERAMFKSYLNQKRKHD